MIAPGSPSARAAPSIEITPLGRTAAAAVLFRRGGRLYVTLIVKATFGFVPSGPMQLTDPEEILWADAHIDGDRGRSARAVIDTSPVRERADVLFTGHAYAPRGFPVPQVAVRLSVARHEQKLLDKVLHVYGDRAPTADRPSPEPAPFHRVPIVYERALGGPGVPSNPAGVGLGSARGQGPQPNIVSPDPRHRAGDPAGFGPIPASWPARSRLLTPEAVKGLKAPVLAIDAIAPAYFQAAPEDQRVDFLRGDEWILLENLHPLHARMVMGLPSARAEARIFGPQGYVNVEMNADTLLLDGDAERCSVTWRGTHLIPEEVPIEKMRAAAGVATAASPIAWNVNLTENRPTPGVSQDTLPDAAGALSLKAPFHVAKPGEGKAAEPLPGAPWSPIPARAPIAPSSALDAQTLVGQDSAEMPEALRRIIEGSSAAAVDPHQQPPAEEPPQAQKSAPVPVPVPASVPAPAPAPAPRSSEKSAWHWASPPPSEAPAEDANPDRRPAPTRTPAAPSLNRSLYQRFTKKKP